MGIPIQNYIPKIICKTDLTNKITIEKTKHGNYTIKQSKTYLHNLNDMTSLTYFIVYHKIGLFFL